MFIQGDRSIRKGTLDGRLIERACLGSNDLFYVPWLRSSAVETILTKFGQTDGPLVIEAANDYLDNLEDTEANNLATYINEDPMMVCSLGLGPQGITMPIRWLENNGYAYIDTKVKLSNYSSYSIEADYLPKRAYSNYEQPLFSTWISNYNYWNLFLHSSGNLDLYRSGHNYLGTVNIGVKNSIKIDYASYTARIVHNSNNYTVSSLYNRNPTTLKIYSRGDLNGTSYYGFRFFNIEGVRQYLPFQLGKAWSADKVSTGVAQAKDTLGMIDLVTGIFYPNAGSGSFTIEYTLPNGTTWTPLS